jgi:FkbM family methyltransferase
MSTATTTNNSQRNLSLTAILLFVPTYKNQLTGTTLLATHALGTHLRSRGIEYGITAISNPDVEWVRNWALTLFYDKLKQYSHILMIDDDMGFLPDVVTDMLAFGEPVVGALYPKKTAEREWAVSGLPNPQFRGPFIEVEGLGCGCFLIRRDAVMAMLEKMPELSDTRPHTVDSALFRESSLTRLIRAFDKINDPKRGTVSEDISFGRRWRECGGQVWAATHHQMVHVGPHEYADTYIKWQSEEQVRRTAKMTDKINAAPILKENPVLRGKGCKHGMFIYNPNDTFIGRSLEAYGEWSEFEIDMLKNFIKDGDTVIDVGANIGTHTVAFSRIVGKHGKVFSFEAQPRLEAILAANIKLNELGNVFWDQKAVGSECSKLALPPLPPDGDEANFGNFGIYSHVEKSDGRPDIVELTTIDSFAADGEAFGISPTVIKIDVEGMEADVIRGAIGTIERCKPVIYLDHGEDTRPEIAAALDEIGYVAYWHLGPFFNPQNAFKNQKNIWPAQQMLAANLIAIPRRKVSVGMIGEELPPYHPNVPLLGLQLYTGPSDTWRAAMERMAAAHQRQAAE